MGPVAPAATAATRWLDYAAAAGLPNAVAIAFELATGGRYYNVMLGDLAVLPSAAIVQCLDAAVVAHAVGAEMARRRPAPGLVAAVARVRREPRTQRSDRRSRDCCCVRFVGWLVASPPEAAIAISSYTLPWHTITRYTHT